MIIYVDGDAGPLPSLDEQIRLDASGVWDHGGDAPGVMIHGGSGSFAGLISRGNGCEIYGLYITAFNGNGIRIESAGNTVGGAGPGQRNVVSGNGTGITVSGSAARNNNIRNNYVGLTALGTTSNPNGTGILLTNGASNNTIGGHLVGESNFIAGNTSNGLMIESSGTMSNLVAVNGIGVGADWATALPNGQDGIRIQNGPANTSVGGAGGLGNIIVNNGSSGIDIVDAGTGTDVIGNLIAGNSLDGITVADTPGCVFGDNTISGNTLAGVRVSGLKAEWNLIWPNSIYGNGTKGIILQHGANSSIPAPAINRASHWRSSGTTCPSCWVALYSDAGDEGQVYHDTVRSDTSGNWSYSGDPLFGPNLTATAIDVFGNTSEFSAPAVVKFEVCVPLVSKQ
jgi:parallel beta-helix repeat protein